MFDQYTKTCRFIDSPRASAKENMAIDNALFACFNESSEPIFRLYNWFSSCSVGMSQNLTDMPMQDCVQRMTGGGTLFHGHDISYAILIPAHFLKKYTVKESYEKICSFLISFYKNLGLDANFAKYDPLIKLSKDSFCQNGFEPYDILIDGKKIGGNAQKRNKNIIFQHGSIALYKHMTIKENIGYSLEDFDIKIGIEEAKEKLKASFVKTFSIELNTSEINTQEQKMFNTEYS